MRYVCVNGFFFFFFFLLLHSLYVYFRTYEWCAVVWDETVKNSLSLSLYFLSFDNGAQIQTPNTYTYTDGVATQSHQTCSHIFIFTTYTSLLIETECESEKKKTSLRPAAQVYKCVCMCVRVYALTMPKWCVCIRWVWVHSGTFQEHTKHQ